MKMNNLFLLIGASLFSGLVLSAEPILIRGATVHSMTEDGELQNTDVLISDGYIQALGSALEAPNDAIILEADGRSLTPGLFGGISGIGTEEISLAKDTVDTAYESDMVRPEFEVLPAYNPNSSLVAVARVEGITQVLLAPDADDNIVAGQGQMIGLEQSYEPEFADPVLIVDLGSDASSMSGDSRAAQFMLLKQMLQEARSARTDNGPHQMLSAAGRAALKPYISGSGRILFQVDRASDIVQVIRLADAERLDAVIVGGAEAWAVADRLAAAGVPVILNPLENEPEDFDRLGARLDNAALLQRAGVDIAFTLTGDNHNVRRIRQGAGNAVAQGLPWVAGLAALTTGPARIFGYSNRGAIAVGQRADLVLWSGDPLEVTSVAEQVILNGKQISMESRQTKLLQRYLPESTDLPRAYAIP